MGSDIKDQKDMAGIFKKVDFSRFSTTHKNQLWNSLNAMCCARLLTDDELDAAAGGQGAPQDPRKKTLTESY